MSDQLIAIVDHKQMISDLLVGIVNYIKVFSDCQSLIADCSSLIANSLSTPFLLLALRLINANTMLLDLQPTLEDDLVHMRPLVADDFESLYAVALDPLIWEQHPNKTRYQRPVFESFFSEALKSKGALIIIDRVKNIVIGSSRYYEYNLEKRSVIIGYTFLSRDYWGSVYNRAVKTLMLNHAFKSVDEVVFEIGAGNIRSQKAIEKIGAIKTGTIEKDFPGEENKINFIYRITKKEWESIFSLTKETKP